MSSHIGEIYGCYKIVGISDKKTSDGHKIYKCECVECGQIFEFKRSSLSCRKTNKCTHYNSYGKIKIKTEVNKALIRDHRINNIFRAMMNRCYDSRNKDYNRYGDRGITVCQEWIDDPASFEEWAYKNGYKNNLTIDRINEDRNYCPDNCRWVTLEENSRFKSTTNYITATVTLSGKQWASLIPEHGINYINNMIRADGIDKSRQYIEQRLCDKHKISV